ncbi:hypothetical protein [Nannocystis radixulma]|uniref:hypothetical protein n=1 Tax=Nannocystis radixulma TaxID=2995305 RepID=UPI00232D583D|nr:hypothetical protein [Nannocystis radixulma]
MPEVVVAPVVVDVCGSLVVSTETVVLSVVVPPALVDVEVDSLAVALLSVGACVEPLSLVEELVVATDESVDRAVEPVLPERPDGTSGL